MRYHLCCNQLNRCWEVRDQYENILFKGCLKEANEYIDRLEKKSELYE